MKKHGGFTLIELVLFLAVSSIIIVTLLSILRYSIGACKLGETEDEILLNGRYAIEYIKREIKSADKIISTNKFDFLDELYECNFGFVVMNYNPNSTYKYNYCTYYFKNNKIYRIAVNRQTDRLPRGNSFDGHNVIAEYIISMEDTKVNFDTKTIDLSFVLGEMDRKEIKFELKLGITCPIIY